jgi:NADH-quinone oxidoreductase subunit A
MLTAYILVLVAIAMAVALAVGMLLVSHLLGLIEARPKRGKWVPYECGNEPIGDARQRFPVKFYAIAMLFIVFDIEVVFFFPWALVRHLSSRIHLPAANWSL